MEKTEERKIEIDNLEAGLKALSGKDFEIAERMARKKGDATPMIQFSSTFQAALAAKALNVTSAEITDLPLPTYVSIVTKVGNFLLSDTAKEMGMEK